MSENTEVLAVKDEDQDLQQTDEAVSSEPFFEYLKSAQGHEIAQRIIAFFEDIKKATLERTTDHAKFEKLLQVSIIIVVVLATSILTGLGKFDSSVGVLFGTLVGYLFGKK